MFAYKIYIEVFKVSDFNFWWIDINCLYVYAKIISPKNKNNLTVFQIFSVTPLFIHLSNVIQQFEFSGLVSKSKGKVAKGGQIFRIGFLHSSPKHDATNSEPSSTFSTTDKKRNSTDTKWYLQLSFYVSKQDGCSVSSSADDIVSPRTNSTTEVSRNCFLIKYLDISYNPLLSFNIIV